MPGGPGPAGRPRRPRGPHARAGRARTRSSGSSTGGPSSSTTACGSRRSSRRWTRSSSVASGHVTGEVRLRFEAPGRLHGRGPSQPSRPLRPRPGHLRRQRHLPPPRRRGFRADLRARRRDLGGPPGAGAGLVTLWQGRFGDEMADVVSEFTVSVGFDWALAADDLAGSRAHVRGLGRGGVLTERRGRGAAGRAGPGRRGGGRRTASCSRPATRTCTPPSSGG